MLRVSRNSPILCWVVNIGYAGRNGIAKRLRNIKSIVPRIRADDEQAINCMIGAMREAASSQLVVAGIFVQQTRENSRGHICANAVVGK